MSQQATQDLYALLPAVVRRRDAERGYPLRDLVAILAAQGDQVDQDIRRLYDDQFIETCQDWVVPYLGDLLGVRGTFDDPVLSSRAEVANTLGYRRRKGTAAVLEQLARDVTRWPARVVEFFQLLATNQHLNHVRPAPMATVDLRQALQLELVDGSLDQAAHTIDVRRVAPGEGWHNIPHVGLFVYRLQSYPQLLVQPRVVDELMGRYTFSTLGQATPLFIHPQSETGPASIAEEINLPVPLRKRFLHVDLSQESSPSNLYGPGLSLGVFELVAGEWNLVSGTVAACDLADWDRILPPEVAVAIDPERGRLRFTDPTAVPDELRISCYHGFSAGIGGGQYDRSDTLTDVSGLTDDSRFYVGSASDPEVIGRPEIDITSPRFFEDLASALVAAQAAWPGDSASATRLVEIVDSRTYAETLPALAIPSNRRLIVRAADGQRPTVLPSGPLMVSGSDASGLELDGLWIGDYGIVVAEALDTLVLRHMTLVPGLSLDEDGNPFSPGAVSLTIEGNATEASITRSILGGVRTAPEATTTMADSILDVHGYETVVAFGGLDGSGESGGPLSIVRSTVIGRMEIASLILGEDAIFLGPVIVERRQEGCVRYSWVAAGSRVPRRYRCAPDIPANTSDEDAARLTARQAPRFTSLTYGQPAYGQLEWRAPRGILRGAEAGTEMGAFNLLRNPQREDLLRLRLDAYLPVGLEAGILFAT